MQWAANCVRDGFTKNMTCVEGEWVHIADIIAVLKSARFEYKRVSKQALRDGSLTHKLIHRHFLGKKVNLWVFNMAVTNAFTAFLKFCDDYHPAPLVCEETIYGEFWAGTCDFIGTLLYDTFNSPSYLLDWKTSSGLYGNEARIQTAAYRSAIKPQDVVLYHGAVRLDKKTAEYEFKDYSKTYNQDLKIFNLMVQLFYESRPRIAKKAGYKWT